MSRNLPNQITFSRLLIAIVFFVLLTQFDAADPEPRRGLLHVCFWLFCVAGATDVLDGYLARKYKVESSLGRILDPFVDKILVCGAFVFFVGPGFVDASGASVSHVAPWMVVLILGRELLVTGLRGVAEGKGAAFGAIGVGKLKMLFQSITAGWVMATESLLHDVHWFWDEGQVVAIYVTVAITAYSAYVYVRRAYSVLREPARA